MTNRPHEMYPDADEVLQRNEWGFRVKPATVQVDAKEHFAAVREVRELRAENERLRAVAKGIDGMEGRLTLLQSLAEKLEAERDAADRRAFDAAEKAMGDLVGKAGEAPEGSMLDAILSNAANWYAGLQHETAKRAEMEELLTALQAVWGNIDDFLRLAQDPEKVRNYATSHLTLGKRELQVTLQVPGGMTPAQHIAAKEDEIDKLRAEVAHLREQRDQLQATGTRLVEERRALKAELEARLAAGRSGEAA